MTDTILNDKLFQLIGYRFLEQVAIFLINEELYIGWQIGFQDKRIMSNEAVLSFDRVFNCRNASRQSQMR